MTATGTLTLAEVRPFLSHVEDEGDGYLRAECPWCGQLDGLVVHDSGFRCTNADCGHVDHLWKLAQKLNDDGELDAQAEPQVYMTLAELLKRPELLEPPECVMPRLAFRGRGLLFCAPDKSGKSTFFAHAVRALTLGHSWLGEPTVQGRVVWCGLEEALGDAVRRFHELGADPERIQLVTLAPNDLLERTDVVLTEWPADLLVVDSLHEYARITYGETPADGDNALWGAVVRPLLSLARRHNVALCILHHVRRSDGEGRGASEIFAAVDATLTMYMPKAGDDPTVRRIHGRGRWAIEPFSVALKDGVYGLAGDGDLSLDARLLLHVETKPGQSTNQLRELGGSRKQTVVAALNRLAARGAIRNHGSEAHTEWYPAGFELDLEGA